ncbi:MAG: sigma-70 family RNA polymerase sigma factor [Planctomycetaceae bacterium]
MNDLLSGSPGAWNSFVDRFSGLIVQVIRHTSHAHSLKLNQDDVDDLTADVLMVLLERDMNAIRAFRGRCSFSTYLAVVVRRVVIRKLTQRRYMQAFGHVQAHQTSLAESGEGPVRQVDQRDEVEHLMSQLPEALSRLMHLFYLRNWSYDRISRVVGIPRNSIGPLLARARAMLQNVRHPTG